MTGETRILNGLSLIQTGVPVITKCGTFIYEAEGCYYDEFYNAYVECTIGYDEEENCIGFLRHKQCVGNIELFEMLVTKGDINEKDC